MLAATAPPIGFCLSHKCGTLNVFRYVGERVRLKHLKISSWRGRPVHPHAASKNKSLGRILLRFIEKGFEDCNIIFRQCARDLGRKHFVTERCWVEQSSVGNTSSKPMLERCRARREISAKATAVQRNASRIHIWPYEQIINHRRKRRFPNPLALAIFA